MASSRVSFAAATASRPSWPRTASPDRTCAPGTACRMRSVSSADAEPGPEDAVSVRTSMRE